MVMMTTTAIHLLLLTDLVADLPVAVRLQRLVGSLRAHFGCEAVALLKLDGEHLRPVAMAGLSSDALGRRFAIADHPRLAAILQRRGVLCFHHDSALPDPYDGLVAERAGEPLPVHDCMGMALDLEGERWGVITLDALRVGTFDTQAQRALGELACAIEAAVRVTRLEAEIRALRLSGGAVAPSADAQHEDSDFVGQSGAITQLLHELRVVADAELPVLLLGETGVGKEL